jgi:hypothetical protein
MIWRDADAGMKQFSIVSRNRGRILSKRYLNAMYKYYRISIPAFVAPTISFGMTMNAKPEHLLEPLTIDASITLRGARWRIIIIGQF